MQSYAVLTTRHMAAQETKTSATQSEMYLDQVRHVYFEYEDRSPLTDIEVIRVLLGVR
jgi:hypothetical protein